MAAEYFLYNIIYNNTLINRSKDSFAPLPPNTGEIFIDYFIPTNQPLYLYRETGNTIVENDQNTIDAYLESIAPPPQPQDEVLQEEFTGYTATTNNVINNKVSWINTWSGGTYYKNDMVTDNGWTMVANKETTDRAAPEAVGNEQFLYFPLNPSGTSTTAKQIVFGMQYSGSSAYWLNGYRVYVTAGNRYEIILVEDPYGANQVSFVNDFIAETSGWRTFGLIPKPIVANTAYQILAITNEPDPTPVTVTANYNYNKPNNNTIPGIGEIVHSNKELASLAPGSFSIGRNQYIRHQLTDPVTLANGRKIHKPASW